MINAPTSSDCLDRSILADIRELNTPDENVLGDIIALYIGDAPRQLSKLTAAISVREFETVRQLAHSLKGSSLGVGARRMGELCSTIEVAAREQAFERVAVHAERLPVEFELACMALEEAARA